MEEDRSSQIVARLSVILIGVATAAFVVTIYHCIAVGWCNERRRTTQGPRQPRANFMFEQSETPSSIENSMVQLIPVHKYHKGVGSLAGEDGTCAVCLSEFEEGEDLRTLPECMHSFHVPCIDMWLFSHSNCPMCRTDATPSPQIFQHSSDYGSGGPETQQEPSLLPDIIVQSRTV